MPANTNNPAPRTRVAARLLAAIGGLSLLDLALTLWSMKTLGMYEANPIVHCLARSACPATTIALFKLATTGFAVGILYGLRHRGSAQLATGLLAGVMGWLTVQWVRYVAFIASLDWVALAAVARESGWIAL